MSSERGAVRSGFTLLEVLAAVAVLAILYTTLADVAIQGLRAEGVSKRRMEASLMADETLAQIELGIDAGEVPLTGVQETEDETGLYRITTTVEPLVLPFLPTPEPGEELSPALALLTGQLQGSEPPLRSIEVRISWLEAGQEFDVLRTTYAYDSAVLELLLPTSGEEGEITAEDLDLGIDLPPEPRP